MKILGLGHSHIVAVAKGCYALQDRGVRVAGAALSSRFIYLYDPEVAPALVGEGVETRLNPRLVDILRQERPDCVLLSVHGNEHVALSIMRPRDPVDFILGESPDLPFEAGATPLTEAAVRETLREKMAETFRICDALRRVVTVPVFCLESPPPLPDARIVAYPGEFFKKAVDVARLSSETFRYKVWRVQSGLYREICVRHGMTFVPAPACFIVPPGVLAEEAWGADATHANPLFGEAMIDQTIRIAQRRT